MMENPSTQAGALVLFLIGVNFLPLAAHLIFHDRFRWAVDGGLRWRDGRPLFGPHKTLRGILAALAGGVVLAPILGIGFGTAVGAAALAMVGDLATSFVKRRMDRPSGSPVFALDHGLEGLLPLVLLVPAMGLTAGIGALALATFVPLGYLGSRLWQYLLYHPSMQAQPRIIRAPSRIREWRACHMPSARWHRWFNFENFVYYRVVLHWFFRLVGRYEQGVRNVLAVELPEHTLWFPDSPRPSMATAFCCSRICTWMAWSPSPMS